MSPDTIASLEDALRELRNLERLLRPRMREGEEMADTVSRLISEKAKPSPVVAPGLTSPLTAFKTAKQIVASCPALTKDSLKKMMFHSRTNGLELHLVRFGRRVLIDEQGFHDWLRGRQKRAA